MSQASLASRPARRFATRPIWVWPNVLSCDAPLVAVTWQAAVAQRLDVALGWHCSFVLALTVWLIYLADRLFDARRLDATRPHSLRHGFHQRYSRSLRVAGFVALVTLAGLVLERCSLNELHLGGGLLAVIVCYTLRVHWERPQGHRCLKEIQVGILFACGTTLSIWAVRPSLALLVVTVLSGMLFAVNCLLVAAWERPLDEAQRMPSLARAYPLVERIIPTVLLAIAVATIAAAWCEIYDSRMSWMIGISAVSLFGLQFGQRWLGKSLCCLLADATLLFPAAVVWSASLWE